MLTKLGLAALAATIGLTGMGATASAHERDGRVVVMDHGPAGERGFDRDHDGDRDRIAHERLERLRLERLRYAQWQRARLRAERQRQRLAARRARLLAHDARRYRAR